MFYAGLCMCPPLNYMMLLFGFPQTILQRSDMLMQSEFFSFRVYHHICVEKQTYTHKFCYPVHVQKEIYDLRTKLPCSCDNVSEKREKLFFQFNTA